MPEFDVWWAETYGGRLPEGELSTMDVVSADSDWEAAELFAEHVYQDWDCPQNLELFVRERTDGDCSGSAVRKKFKIEVDWDPSFSAHEVEPADSGC